MNINKINTNNISFNAQIKGKRAAKKLLDSYFPVTKIKGRIVPYTKEVREMDAHMKKVQQEFMARSNWSWVKAKGLILHA